MKLKVKPFTLFLYGIIFLLLFIGPEILSIKLRLPDPLESLSRKKPEWTGLITLWYANFIDCGVGSTTKWLNWQIERFEKNNPGVFIDVSKITPERMKMYFQGNVKEEVLPDIIALPPYENFIPSGLLLDLNEFFNKEEMKRFNTAARKYAVQDNRMIRVPYMMGAYALIFNNQLAQERGIIIPEGEMDYTFLDSAVRALTFTKKEGKVEKEYHGFCTYSMPYSRPLLSIIHCDEEKIISEQAYNYLMRWHKDFSALPKGMMDFTYSDAWSLFAEQARVGIMLGSPKVIYQMRTLQQSGKGFDITVKSLPSNDGEGLFIDQIAAFGVLKTGNHDKLKLCVSFLKGLLEDKAQQELKHIGMFSVITTIADLYTVDPQMYELENSLKNYLHPPDDKNRMQALQSEYSRIKQGLESVSGAKE